MDTSNQTQPTTRETIKLTSSRRVEEVKRIMHEGNVRREAGNNGIQRGAGGLRTASTSSISPYKCKRYPKVHASSWSDAKCSISSRWTKLEPPTLHRKIRSHLRLVYR